MNKQKKAMLAVLVVAVMVMAVGYAALTAKTLTIGGSAKAVVDGNNFVVVFTGTKTGDVDAGTTVTANSTSATINFGEFSTANQTKSEILEVKNTSTVAITADSVAVTTDTISDSNFTITTTRCNADGTTTVPATDDLAQNGVTYFKVTVKLNNAVATDVTGNVSIVLTATPVGAGA